MSLLGDGDQRGILIIYAAQPEPGGLASTIGWMFNDEIWWRSVVDGSYRDWVTEHYASS